jgi:hypothetical protein
MITQKVAKQFIDRMFEIDINSVVLMEFCNPEEPNHTAVFHYSCIIIVDNTEPLTQKVRVISRHLVPKHLRDLMA